MDLVKRFLSAIIGSKKAVAVVATIIFVLLAPQLAKLGVTVTKDELETVVQLVLVFVAGQAIADVGKGKAQWEAAQAAKARGTVDPEGPKV